MGQKLKKRRWYLRILRRLWHVSVALLVLVAVYQTGGRLLMPHLGGQKENLEAQLSGLLGAPVTIGELRGSWFRFSPAFELKQLVIAAGSERHSLERITVQLDAIDSLLGARPAVTRIHIDGMDLALQEDAARRWSLAGLPRGTGPDYSQQILDFLLQTRGIDFTESQLRLQRAGSDGLVVSSLFLDVRNRRDQHELQSQFRINGQQSPSHVHVTLVGDPREEFTASVYAETTELELAGLLGAREAGGWQMQNLRVTGATWIDASHNGIRMLRTALTDLSGSVLHGATQRSVALDNAAFGAYVRPDADNWEAGITDLTFDLQQTPWEVPALQVQVDSGNELTLRAAVIDLGLLHQLVTLLPAIPQSTVDIVDTLAPRGLLNNLHVETALDGSRADGFLVQANLEDVAVNAWSGAPAARGVQGYVQMNAQRGYVDVDSDDLELHLPRLFAQAWHYDHVDTRVHWDIGVDSFRIGSSAIAVRAEGLDGSVRFDLYNSRDAAGARVAELTLLVGMRSMDMALRSAYLPTLPRLKPTMDWLQAALQGGTIRDSGFLLRTSTVANAPRNANTFSTWYHVENGRLQFLPDWPALENITADAVVRDGNVVVQTQQASIAGMALNPAVANVVAHPDGGSLLTVRGSASTDTALGLAFLRESPVRNAIGPVIDNWQANGAIAVDIALDIPLGDNTALDPNARVIDVKVQSTGSELALTDYALTIGDINGLVHYRSDSGLAADALSARMFDMPIVAGIETLDDPSAGRRTRITSAGRAGVPALRAWQQQPELVRNLLGYMNGEIDYTATLDILHRTGADGIRTRLQIVSDLLGLDSQLPRPFGKTAAESDALQLELTFLTDGQVLSTSYDDFLSGRIELDEAGIERGQLYFGALNRDFNIRQSDENTPGLLLNGELAYFNYEEWMDVVGALAGRASTPQRPLAEYLRLLDMKFGTLDILGQQLEDISVQVQVDQTGWQIDGMNPLVGGHLTIPLGTAPWTVNLDYLRFPPRIEPELDAAGEPIDVVKVDVLEAVNPASLPAFDFATAELSIGDQGLGAVSFELRPGQSGAAITDFRLTAEDSGITDNARTGGAVIDWRYASGMHTSTFSGVFSAKNLAQVLPRWGHGANVESEDASFTGMLNWSGSPLAFTLREASGQLQLEIRDGRFVEIQSGSARVFGALNFDALVRRLQLDFSDIFQSGYTFDTITADLAMERGVVTTIGQAVIDGPSSKISINGEIDLAQETIAADMEVQIPLGQNVSMLAGLLGAWPIALSTYLASIIFAETVADFATVIYRLDGPWANPAAAFEAPVSANNTQEP